MNTCKIHAGYMQDTSGYVLYRKTPPICIGNPPSPGVNKRHTTPAGDVLRTKRSSVAAALGFRAPHHAEISVDVDSLSVTRSSMNDMSVRIMEGDVFSEASSSQAPTPSPLPVPTLPRTSHHRPSVRPRPYSRPHLSNVSQQSLKASLSWMRTPVWLPLWMLPTNCRWMWRQAHPK